MKILYLIETQVFKLFLRQKCCHSAIHAKVSVTLTFLSYALIRGWHNQTRFDLHGKGFFSNESNSEIAIYNVHKTNLTSCKFVNFRSQTVTVGYYNASAR